MATIIANGCFDLFHEGHHRFLTAAKFLGVCKNNQWYTGGVQHRLIVCVNSDESANLLKSSKWGDRYPIDNLFRRMENVMRYADETISFDTEDQLHEIIKKFVPCILVKGPDYAAMPVTGDDIAPVLILDTPEPEAVKQMKQEVYRVKK